jgi:hypothetical protein
MFNNDDRKRLYKEAKSFLTLRQKRKKYVADFRADGIDPSIKEAAVQDAKDAAIKSAKEHASV